ncbi:MAG: hypothetical protein JF588_19275 [Caulobacterales bacterium]|nr:hypothetical protein [Caulobacterales bacterium]
MGAGKAIAGGFFGCFGVLGAIVLGLFLLVIVAAMGQRHAADQRDDAWAALDARGICGQWTRAAEARHNLTDVTLTHDDPIVAGRDPARVTCFATAANRKGKLRMEISVFCPNASSTSCSMLQDTWLNDRRLKWD